MGLFLLIHQDTIMNTVLFDDVSWHQLKPLTFTRPIAKLRVGIDTIQEKWQDALDVPIEQISFYTQDYLSKKYPAQLQEDNLFVNASVFPNEALIAEIKSLKPQEYLIKDETIIAFRKQGKILEKGLFDLRGQKTLKTQNDFVKLNHVWDIFRLNEQAIKDDFKRLTKGKTSQSLHESNIVIGDPNDLFLEEGSSAYASTFNTMDGPIYIGKNAKVLEGGNFKGSLAICENAVTKMAAKIYKGTTLGPYAKVGGELSNVVIQGYSNKGHDGYLGNAVIGEWCNLGADTNCSNLKNNYGEIKVWSYPQNDFVKSGLQFCGLLMGDHSKSAINTMFNTGTIVGVAANIFGAGFPPKHIPSFSWGGYKDSPTYQLDKAFETAERVMKRREKVLSDEDKEILQYLFHESSVYRS